MRTYHCDSNYINLDQMHIKMVTIQLVFISERFVNSLPINNNNLFLDLKINNNNQ